MKILNVKLKNYRNIEAIQFSPTENVNVIYGDNAQGKTNIVEAIWLCTGMNSFRGAKAKELIRFDAEEQGCNINVSFFDNREQTIDMSMGKEPKLLINGVSYKNKKELLNNFFAVIFSSHHLSFFKDGPKYRRKFLDDGIAQVKPHYLKYQQDYAKLLTQRNALIKDYRRYSNLSDILEVWDRQLAKIGTIIEVYRYEYADKLARIAGKLYNKLSSSKEELEVIYRSDIFTNPIFDYSEESYNIYLEALSKSIDKDKQIGITSRGAHRADVTVLINEIDTKTYGSQGQQRSAVIALKLSEAKIIELVTKQMPIVLLDDVMSELDEKRQEYILNHVKNSQVFITCCDYNNIVNLKKGKVFLIEKGRLVTEKQVDY